MTTFSGDIVVVDRANFPSLRTQNASLLFHRLCLPKYKHSSISTLETPSRKPHSEKVKMKVSDRSTKEKKNTSLSQQKPCKRNRSVSASQQNRPRSQQIYSKQRTKSTILSYPRSYLVNDGRCLVNPISPSLKEIKQISSPQSDTFKGVSIPRKNDEMITSFGSEEMEILRSSSIISASQEKSNSNEMMTSPINLNCSKENYSKIEYIMPHHKQTAALDHNVKGGTIDNIDDSFMLRINIPNDQNMSPELCDQNISYWYEISSLFEHRPSTILFCSSPNRLPFAKKSKLKISCNERRDAEVPEHDTLQFKIQPSRVFVANDQLQNVKLLKREWKDKRKDVQLYYKFQNAVPFRVVKQSFSRGGFRKLINAESENWNALWAKKLKAEDYMKLNPYQKVNHFPGTYEISRKDNLHRNLSRMKRLFGSNEFNFFPDSFLLPEEKEHFTHTMQTHVSSVCIVKPRASACGKGIKLVNHVNQIRMDKPVIVQHYIQHPLLINNRKFDLRLYVLITSYDPLRIYMHKQGLVRFATEEYHPSKRLKNKYVHLTNYAVNKQNQNKDTCNESIRDCKWSLEDLRKYFQENKIDDGEMWHQIHDMIIKTLIAAEPTVVNHFYRYFPHGKNVCYELFGFDVLIDRYMKPWLLEVNSSPSLHTDTPLDQRVKSNVMIDMFNIVGFVHYHRSHYKKMVKQQQKQRILYGLSQKNMKTFDTFDTAMPSLGTSSIGGTNDSIRVQSVNSFGCNSITSAESSTRTSLMNNNSTISSNNGMKSNTTRSSMVTKMKLNGNQLKYNELKPQDQDVIEETEDEYMRRGSFIRLFPSADNVDRYAPLFEVERYKNMLIAQWLKSSCPPH